jgi:peptide/nickel transport system permease protein
MSAPGVRRLLAALGTLVGVALLVFVALRVVPGSSITASLGIEAGTLTPAQRQALEHYYGVDQPAPQQFLSWLQSIVSGNLGYSVHTGESVATMTKRAFPVTLELALLSTILGSIVGISIGAVAASRPGSARDGAGQAFGLLGLAVPVFVIGTALVTVLASRFGYFPNGEEYAGPFDDPWLHFQQMLFPTIVLALGFAAIVMRTTRSAMVEVRRADFIRTARGKGLSPQRITVRHVLRNALIPIITIIGIQFGYLLGGAVIVEQIFALPGLGRQLVLAINEREYAVVQSTVLILAVAFVLVNVAVDVLYARIDPRVRKG